MSQMYYNYAIEENADQELTYHECKAKEKNKAFTARYIKIQINAKKEGRQNNTRVNNINGR